MSATPFWDQVRALKGQTLHSVAQSKTYDVVDVSSDVVVLQARDGGRIRKLRRNELEPFYDKLQRDGELDSKEIKSVYTFNSSPAAAVLAALDGVTFTTNPIRLYFRRP